MRTCGIPGTYVDGCRCPDCKRAEAMRRRRYRERKAREAGRPFRILPAARSHDQAWAETSVEYLWQGLGTK